MKTVITITITAILTILLTKIVIKEPTLEIYTYSNIYYLDGLTLTNESNNEMFTFSNKAEAYNYIAQLTADESAPYANN